MTPVIESSFQCIFNQQCPKAGTVDKQITGDLLPILQLSVVAEACSF